MTTRPGNNDGVYWFIRHNPSGISSSCAIHFNWWLGIHPRGGEGEVVDESFSWNSSNLIVISLIVTIVDDHYFGALRHLSVWSSYIPGHYCDVIQSIGLLKQQRLFLCIWEWENQCISMVYMVGMHGIDMVNMLKRWKCLNDEVSKMLKCLNYEML